MPFTFSKSVTAYDMALSSRIHYNNSKNLVEELTSEAFLAITSTSKSDKSFVNQDIDDNTRIYATKIIFDNIKQKTILRSTSNNSKLRQHKKLRCHFFQLLKFCWSFFF
jgi:hypothetical protein